MFSSLKTSIKNVLSPKTLLSNYIASTLSSYFLNVDSTQIESTLLSDECKKIRLKNVKLKPLYVSGVVVRGEVKLVEFSWTWGDRNNIITNVEFMMKGVHVVITPEENKHNDDYVKIEMAQNDKNKEEIQSSQDVGEKEDDWKTKYFKQIVDHLTLILDDVSIDVYLPPPPSSTENDEKEEWAISFRGEHFEIVSFGRQQQQQDEGKELAVKASSSSVPLSQELILNSLSCFVVSIPSSSSSQYNPENRKKEEQENGATGEEEDEFFNAQEEDNEDEIMDGSKLNETDDSIWEKEEQVTKSIQNHLSRISSSSDPVLFKVYTLIAPFNYKTSIKRVSGQRFLDGIFTGLEVKGISGGEEEKVQMYMDVIQVKALHRLGTLVAAITSSSLEENTAKEETNTAMATDMTNDSSSSDAVKENRRSENSNDFSLFILPFQFISLTLPPTSSNPSPTTISMEDITCTYRTDGQLLTILGTGGLSITNSSSSKKEVEVIQKDAIIWNVDMITSQLSLSPGVMTSDGDVKERMTINCPLDEIETIMNGLKRLMMVTDVAQPSSMVASSAGGLSSATPWSMNVNGMIIFHLEADKEEKGLSWMDIAIEEFCIKSTANRYLDENDKAIARVASLSNESDENGEISPAATNALETEISFKQILITSSSSIMSTSPLFTMTIPESIFKTKTNQFIVNPKQQYDNSGDNDNNNVTSTDTISISMLSTDAMQQVYDFTVLYKNAITFSTASSSADSCEGGSRTNEGSSTSIPLVSIPMIEINVMDNFLGNDKGATICANLLSMEHGKDDKMSLLVDSLDVYECTSFSACAFLQESDTDATGRVDEETSNNDIMISVKNIQIDISSSLLDEKVHRRKEEQDKTNCDNIIGEVKIGEVTKCLIPNVGYIASPMHDILLQLSKGESYDLMTMSISCECIDFISTTSADSKIGIEVDSGSDKDSRITAPVSPPSPAVTDATFLQLPCSIEFNLDRLTMTTLEQQEEQKEQHQKDCVVCHKINVKLKPSSDDEMNDNFLNSSSAIVKIGEVSTLEVSGVCRLLEPMQDSTLQLERGVIHLKCNTIEMLKLDSHVGGKEEEERKTSSDKPVFDLYLPFPVCAAIQRLAIKTLCAAGNHEIIRCSQIEMNVKPDTANTPGAEGAGENLPFLGMIKVGEISTFNIPGSGLTTSNMKNAAIRLEHNSIGIRFMSIEALMSSGIQSNDMEPTNEKKIEEILASYPQLPCPMRMLCTKIAVQQVCGDNRKDFFRCTNVDVIAWPGVGGGLPSGVLKIGEISELEISEGGRLSAPTHNSIIKFKNGTLQIECNDVEAIKYDTQAQSGNAQLPLPINFSIANLTVDKCDIDGHVMEWVSCSQISAEMKPAEQQGGLPTGIISIGEVSKVVAEGAGRLLAPMKNTIIHLEENAIHIKCMDLKVVKSYEGKEAKKASTESRDIWLPCSIHVSFTCVEVKQQDERGGIDDWISCSSIEGNIRPDPQGKLVAGAFQVGEIWTFKTPGSEYLLAPMCNSTITLEDDSLQIYCKLISVIKIHADGDDEALHENDSFDLAETKNWLPCPIKLGIESLSVRACDQFGVTENLADCSHINVSAKQGMEGHLPSIAIEVGEVLELAIPGKGYLSAPTKNSIVRLENDCVHIVLPTVKAVMLEHNDNTTTTNDSGASFSLPLPTRLAIAELLLQQRVGSEMEDFIECSFLDLDLKTIQGQELPVGTISVGQVSKLDIVGVFNLSSPLENTIVRCGENGILVELNTIEGVVFDEYKDDNNIEQRTGQSPSTTPKLSFPIQLTVDKILARKAPNKDLIPVDWVCCSGIEADLRPSQSGLFPVGTVKVREVSTLNIPSMGCLSAPVRDSMFILGKDEIEIECKEIEAIKFSASSSINKESSIPGEKNKFDSIQLPCRVMGVIESLTIKEFVGSGCSLEIMLCCSGIKGDFSPSQGGLPSGLLTVGEISALVLNGSGCITAPIMNSTIEVKDNNVSVECTKIEVATFKSPPQQKVEPSKSIDFSLPCPIRMLVGYFTVNTEEIKCSSADIGIMPLKNSDAVAQYSGNQATASTEGSQILIHSIKNLELRNMMKVQDISAKATVLHDRIDVLHGVIISAKCVEFSADFSSIDWPGTLLGKDDKAEQSIVELPYASVAKMRCVLDYKGKVLSVSDASFNVDAFSGEESTTSQTIVEHYIAIVKGRLPAILGSVEMLGSNLTEIGAMHAGRAILRSGTSGTAAVGSMVGLGVKDAFSGAMDAGKKSRGVSSDDKYKFGDLSRGVAASMKNAAKSGSSMRNDDRYVVGDFTAGSVAATGSNVKNNSERLSRAGGATAGMMMGAAVAGPLGMVAGSFIGGKAAGDTVKKLSAAEKNNEDTENKYIARNIPAAAARGSNLSGGLDQHATLKNSASGYHPPPPVAPSYSRIQGHASAEVSMPTSHQTPGQDSMDDPFGLFSAGEVVSERAGLSQQQSQKGMAVGLDPPLRSTQPRKEYQLGLQHQSTCTKPVSHQTSPSPGYAPPAAIGVESERHLQSYGANQSTHMNTVQGNINTPRTNQPRYHPSHDKNSLQQRPPVRSPAPPPSYAANQSRQNLQSQSRSVQPREEQGYRFGDITRSVVARGKKKQGRDENDGYKFGDFTRGLFG